jgi:hypothetical protein
VAVPLKLTAVDGLTNMRMPTLRALPDHVLAMVPVAPVDSPDLEQTV